MAQSWKSTLFTRPPSLPCPSLRGRHGSFANPAAARKERNLGTRGRSGVRRTLDGENQARAREAEKPRGRLAGAGAGSGVRGPGRGPGRNDPSAASPREPAGPSNAPKAAGRYGGPDSGAPPRWSAEAELSRVSCPVGRPGRRRGRGARERACFGTEEMSRAAQAGESRSGRGGMTGAPVT